MREFVSFSTRHKVLRTGLLIVGLWCAVALSAPFIAPYSPTMPHPNDLLQPPSSMWLLGTDQDGIDILSRILWAPRLDLGIAIVATAIAMLIGVPVGALAGYFAGRRGIGGVAANATMRLVDVSLAFPVFVFALALVAALGAHVGNLIVSLAFVNAPVFVWLTRSEMLSARSKPYVEAARCGGNSELRIAFRHVLPNALSAPLTQMSVVLGFSILLTAGLSFVGAGVRVPTPEWGLMVSEGASSMITGQWWPALFPGLALATAVFGFGLVGDGLRVYLDPRQRIEFELRSTRAKFGSGTSLPGSRNQDRVQSSRVAPVPKSGLVSDNGSSDHNLLVVDGLSIRFRGQPEVQALSGVTFDLGRSQTLGVVGTSGSGKSVLAKAIMGLIREPGHVVGGQILFNGTDLLRLSADQWHALRGKDLALIVANARSRLNPLVSVGDQICNAILAKQQVPRREAIEQMLHLLSSVSIGDPRRTAGSLPSELSGGMCQRIVIVMAVCNSPRLLIADEPTAGLDVTVQKQVLDLMIDMVRKSDSALILMTRDLGIIAHYAERVLVLSEGAVVEESPVERFFAEPAHPHSALLLSAAFAARGEAR